VVKKIGLSCKVTLPSQHIFNAPAAGEGDPHSQFQPISYNTLFNNFLKNVSIRKRPPVSLCDMCVGSSALKLEVILLDSLTGLGGEVEEGEEDFQEWHWREYKTRDNAVARLKLCTRMLHARDQHKIWVASQRIAVSPHACARYSHLCFCRSRPGALASSLLSRFWSGLTMERSMTAR